LLTTSRLSFLVPVLFAVSIASTLAVACSSSTNNQTSGGGGEGGSTGTAGGGGASACWQADTLLDVSKSPGAGQGYPAPTLSGVCTDQFFVVDSNNIPTYNFVPITPNPLKSVAVHYEIPLKPAMAAATTKIPLLGTAGFAVNGSPFFGPNEAGMPVQEAYGDPIFNGIMDACLGHTSEQYHYHSFEEKCLIPSGLVAEPWKNPDPVATEPSPIVGWALDGFPIYGPRDCKDAACSSVVVMSSGYDKIGDPTTNAWDAYAYKDHPGDSTFLDECNGHVGPKGDYHYHVTAGFPYILGCYRGTPNGSGQMQMPDGGMPMGDGGMMGPKACASQADCTAADCPPGSKGCTCGQTPMGMACIPTCTTSADCPMGPMGMQLNCNMGVCGP
jgi:hypothetical protein